MKGFIKKYIPGFGVVAITAIIALVALASFSNGKSKTGRGDGILSVNDIQADPYAYKGTITITGVVAKVSKQDPKLFIVIDSSEARACKSTGCARFYLPVRFEGPIPKEWDEVNLIGNIVKDRGPFFEATKVDVLRHLAF